MRRETRSAPTLLGAIGLLAIVVVAAGSAAPWTLEDPRLPDWILELRLEPSEVELERRQEHGLPSPDEPREAADLGWVAALLNVLGALVLLVVVWWLWRRFRYSAAGDQMRPARSSSAVPVSVEEEPELPILRQGVDAARTLLDGARDPTGAIIGAWLAVEEAAASAGVTRRRSQTPTEFTVTVLDRTDADREATRRLLDLYLRARFSGAPTDEQDVAEARRCLVALAASWRALPEDEGAPR